MSNLGFIIPLDDGSTPTDTGDRTNWCTTRQFWTNQNMQFQTGTTTDATTAKVGDNAVLQVTIYGTPIGGGVETEGRISSVQAWICYPNTIAGRFNPATVVPSMNPAAPPSFTADPASPPSNAIVFGGLPPSVFELTPSWTPGAADILPGNTEAHVCMIATCAGYADWNGDRIPVGLTVTSPSDWAKIDTCGDPHQGQRNVTIVGLSKGRMLPSGGILAQFGFLAGSAERLAMAATVEATYVTGPLSPDVLSVLHSGPYANLPLRPSTTAPTRIGLHKNKAGCEFFGRTVKGLEHLLEGIEDLVEDVEQLLGHKGAPGSGQTTQKLNLTLPPMGISPLLLTAELDAKEPVGTVHVFDVTQVDHRTGRRGGIRLGFVFV